MRGQERWRFRGGAAFAMSDPAGLMRDYDWIETAGYRFQYLFQSVQGYEGWQYEWNDGIGAFDLWLIWGSGEVLRYTLFCHALPLGLGLRLAGGPRLELLLEAAWVPVYAMDEDDHLLRYKLSTASGLGHGVEVRLEARSLGLDPDRAGPAPPPNHGPLQPLLDRSLYDFEHPEPYSYEGAGPGCRLEIEGRRYRPRER